MIDGVARPLRFLRHPLGMSVGFLLGFYVLLKLLLPSFGGWLAAEDWFSIRENLSSAGKEISLYMLLAILAIFAYVTYEEERWQEFQHPIWAFLRWRHPVRKVALVAAPLLVGGLVFLGGALGEGEPVSHPILHPTPPDEFSKLTNPYRNPTPEMLEQLDDALLRGEIVAAESSEPEVVAYAHLLEEGQATPEAQEKAFRRRVIEEGRELFMINCRPCHGTKAMGDGPMSVGQRREPADFTGVETIATLVEGAVFWRIKKGGVGLPREGAPWESAMPRWEADLSDDQIWKIILAEYDIAGNAPREPEGRESEPESPSPEQGEDE